MESFWPEARSLWKLLQEYANTNNSAGVLFEIRPHRSVGAGRAGEALAFELVTFAKTSASHIALLGGLYFASCAKGWGCRASGESVFKVGVGRIFGYALPLLPFKLAFWRSFCVWGRFLIWFCFAFRARGVVLRRCIFELFLTMPKQHGPKWSHIAFNTAPKSPKLAPRWHQRSHKVALLDPKMEPT